MATTRLTTTGRKGDLRIAFGFMRMDDFQMPQPCLLLSKVNTPQLMVQVPLPMLYQFDYRDKELNGQPKCLPRCRKVAELIYGGFATEQDAYRVLDAITDWMDDIRQMPPPSTFRSMEELTAHMRRRGFDIAEIDGDEHSLMELAH